MEIAKKKIFIIFPSTSGHINPVSGLVYELCHEHNVECIFYGNVENQQLIERTGATFRLFAHRNFASIENRPLTERNSNEQPMFTRFMSLMFECSYVLIPQLVKDIETDRPDLILYDATFVAVKYLLEVLKKRRIDVKCVEFYPNFVFTKELMKQHMPHLFEKNLKSLASFANILMKQIWFSWSFGLTVFNTFGFLMEKNKTTKLVAVFPELHPRVDDYDHTHKFVGQCASEEARNHEFTDDPGLKALLDLFPSKDEERSNDLKLIYFSLGTVFNNNPVVYQTVIESLLNFDLKPNRCMKLAQIRVVVSLGPILFKTFSERIAKGEMTIPSNIVLRARVPQLEVLKRADLFITHCGMNSTSEAIKYGVPIIAIPIDGDQPLVAIRTCDELSLGIRFDPMKLKADEVADSIEKVLGDESYRNKMAEFSKISAKYNGQVEGAKIIVDYLMNDSEKKPIDGSKSKVNAPNSNQVAPLYATN